MAWPRQLPLPAGAESRRGPFRLSATAGARQLGSETFDLEAEGRSARDTFVWRHFTAELPEGEVTFTLAKHDRRVTHALTRKLLDRKHAGLVIFSSGSTGEPKAVLHDFISLLDKFKRPGIRKTTLSFLLFDHIGGLV